MSKTNRPNRYFSAAVLSVIALWTGGRLKRALIKYLGGQYGIMTEFYSDWAYKAFHQFEKLRLFYRQFLRYFLQFLNE